MPPDDVTVVDVDVIAAVAVTALLTDASPPPAAVVVVTVGRFANSPVPVLSAKRHKKTTASIHLINTQHITPSPC